MRQNLKATTEEENWAGKGVFSHLKGLIMNDQVFGPWLKSQGIIMFLAGLQAGRQISEATVLV